MDFVTHSAALDQLAAPVVAVPVFADDGARGTAFDAANAAANGALSLLADEEGFKGKPGEKLLVHLPGEGVARVLLVGVGARAEFTGPDMRAVAAAVVREANSRSLGGAAILLTDALSDAVGARFAVEGAVLGGYRYDAWKTEGVDPLTCATVTLVPTDGAADLGAIVLARASGVAAGVVLARDLVNGPPVEVTPTRLAEVAQDIAKEHGLAIEVFDKAEIIKRGMNLLMAVGKGSDEEPRFIHLTYTPPGATADTPSIALVGKGITFDAGGYNLKPTGAIEDMKMDMAGAAAVLGAMKAIRAVAPAMVVHGIVPSAENMVSGGATKVADVVRSLHGKTVEIMNTDAEGRLVLADALTYGERLGVDKMVDLATLTGACMVALGSYTAGLWSNEDAFGAEIAAAAKAAGEDVWTMPLTPRLKKLLKSPVADLKNVGPRWGGAITAALFLQAFVGETTWAHIDIAGPAFAEEADDLTPKGGSGFGVLTLLELVGGEG